MIDLPVVVLATERESAHVVLTVWIDALIELIVGAHGIKNLSECLGV